MLVEVKVAGRPSATIDREFTAVDGATTLRALINDLVTDEVAGYEKRRAEQAVFQVLTDTDLAAGQQTGRFRSGGRTAPAAPPTEQAIARALQAFSDGLFYVFLDGQQLENLDEPIAVGPQSRLRLVRLVALAGG